MPIYRCIATERVANRCSNEYNSNLPLIEFDAHFATIDAIKLFKSNGGMLHCLSGGRDSQIQMWNLRSAAEVCLNNLNCENKILVKVALWITQFFGCFNL